MCVNPNSLKNAENFYRENGELNNAELQRRSNDAIDQAHQRGPKNQPSLLTHVVAGVAGVVFALIVMQAFGQKS